ncbi:uncharacterized protein LOC113280965 isoform X2 [Papaver somniferum]|uniref:uncharacterized protein LOC113280965 isoform X2 n=1 Tax=Papaver somniferum TaxID=3469 RepID=UPI000E6FB891|nr:uncharacterized protein LOC113280965 isoform X2 [Papaver somniferum]
MEKNEQGSEEEFNAKIDNSSSHINGVSGGNDKRLESQLQTRSMKGFNGSSTNDELLQVNQGRNLNRKNNNFNKSDGGCVNSASPVIVSDPINKGKDKLDSSTFLRNIGVDGGQQSVTSISFTRNRGADGGQHSVPTNSLSGLSKTIGGFLDSGRLVSSKSPSRTSGDGKSSDRNCDREDKTSGYKDSSHRGRCTVEKAYESSTAGGGACPGTAGLECIFGQSQSGIDTAKIFPLKLDTHGSGGISKSGKGRTRMRVKDVARSNNSSGGNSPNGGNSGSYKNPKRSLEVRDAFQYSLGSGPFLPASVHDKVHSDAGVEQSSHCKENGNAGLQRTIWDCFLGSLYK